MRNCQLLILAAILSVVGCDSRDDSVPVQQPQTPKTEKGSTVDNVTAGDDWQKSWDARLAALEAEFGESEDKIVTSPVPIYLGGGADVLTFKNHIDGVVYISAGLIGDGGQKKTDIGEYELMMCAHDENDWMPSLLSKLAPYTFGAALNPGDTMDISSAMPKGSSIAALLYVPYRQFKVNGTDAGALLCIGITEQELKHCRENGHAEVLTKLNAKAIYPYTDTDRDSVVP